MLTQYIQTALRQAKYEILPDDKSFYGEILDFQGVWANAATFEDCRNELVEVLEEWIIFRLSRNLSLPIVNGLQLFVERVPEVSLNFSNSFRQFRFTS